MNINKWLLKNTFLLNRKVVAITGATGSLGAILCHYLANLNADIIMLDRNLNKSIALKNKLLTQFPRARIENIRLDLADINSVKETGEVLKTKKIDYLILNAGVYNVPFGLSALGYDTVFQINAASPYYLVKTLLPHLQEVRGTVIAVSSIAHDFSKLNAEDIDFSQNKSASKVYGNSKRLLHFSLYRLFKNETEANLSVVHPGITLTNMTGRYPKAINWLVKFLMKILFPSPKYAALSVLAGVFKNCPSFQWIGPKYGNIWGKPKIKTLKTCSAEESEAIFDVMEDVYKKF